MPDRKKVIQGLHCCAHTDGINCAYCPYGIENADCTAQMSMDVLALLKEQEPKQAIGIADSIEGMEVGYCPSCGRTIVNKKIDETKFCKFCGQAVKCE